MLRRFFAVFLTLTLILGICPLSVWAEETEEMEPIVETEERNAGSVELTATEDWIEADWIVGGRICFDSSTGTITDCEVSVTKVDIPATISGVSVTTIGEYAFYKCSSLTSISIPNSVTSIGYGAFEYCSSLTSISIPSSVTSIEDTAFASCSNLTDITVEDGNSEYSSLDGVLFNKTQTVLVAYPAGGEASYSVPSSVTSIGFRAFKGCTSLTNISIPGSVTSIDFLTFENCTSLKSVTIQNGVTSIDGESFKNCTSLTSISIPSSVTYIESAAFAGCSNLANISVEKENKNYSSLNGVLFNKDQTILIAYPARGESSYSIPNSVTEINARAFYGCLSLTSISIPGSVAYIGVGAFASCSNLTDIAVAEGNSEYSSIDGILFNKSQTDLVAYPAGGETSYSIPGSVTRIGAYAFAGCSSLESIDIPNSVTSIWSWAFHECSSLTSISIPDSVVSIGDYAFFDCSSLTSINIPNGMTNIGKGMFMGCKNLTSISIPNSVTNIEDNAFSACMSLTSISIPNNVTSIDVNTFYYCRNLTSISIPRSVTSIGLSAFYGCISLNDVYYSGSEGQWNGISIDSDNEALTSAIIHYNSASEIIATGYCGGEDDGTNLTWTLDSEGVLTIKGSGAMGDYTYPSYTPWYSQRESVIMVVISEGATNIGNNAFENCSNLSSISIPNSVKSIERKAFNGCRNLTSIGIPDSVISIGDWAFAGCSNLTIINIPNSVTSIGDYAFNECTNLTNASIPNGVTSIGSGAFKSCSNLKLTNIPISVTSIETWVFFGCSSLTSISIPNNVTSIGYFAFYGCSSLTGISIPNSVNEIGDRAFGNCNSLTSISIPGSVTYIGDGAFESCSNLTDITVAEGNSEYSSIDGILVNKLQTDLVAYPAGGETSYSIPGSVTRIENLAFAGCTSLTNISIPNSVTSIGSWAFEGCSSLQDVYYSGSEGQWNGISIESDNETLTSATIHYTEIIASGYCGREGDGTNLTWNLDSKGVLTIKGTGAMGDYATYSSYAPWHSQKEPVVRVMISDGVTSIGCEAFYYCSDLTSIIIPDSVTSIGDAAFCGCKNLTSISIPNGVTSIGERAFYKCYSMTSISIPSSVTSIGCKAFTECSGLTDVNISNGVASIGDGAFGDCISLTSISIPSSVTSVGVGAFDGCSNLRKITVAEENSEYCSIDGVLFNKPKTVLVAYPAGGEMSYSIPSSVTNIGDGAFCSCSRLTNLDIPSSVTSIGERAFSGCSSLTSISIPGNVTSIGHGTFEGCSSLTSINIPRSVTNIEKYAFAGCASLTIYGMKGSYAQTYAQEADIPFVPLDVVGVTGVTLNKDTVALNTGDTEVLTETVSPANATNKAVIWNSSNTAVATVENGTVTAVAPGSATITVTTEDGGFSASVVVTVNGKIDDSTKEPQLKLSSTEKSLEREYAQTVDVTVENLSTRSVHYYLQAENPYEDIFLNFVDSGSDIQPITILPGETQNISMSVFLQNAKQEKYTIPVAAYVAYGDTFYKNVVGSASFTCHIPVFNIGFETLSVTDTTLATSYRLKNKGDSMTDLTLYIEGDAKDYVSFKPAYENYSFASGTTLKVELVPDLKKMKDASLTKIAGIMVACGGGQETRYPIAFDTNGREITCLDAFRMALYQDGNPYYQIEESGYSSSFDELTKDNWFSLLEEDGSFEITTKKTYTYEGNAAEVGIVLSASPAAGSSTGFVSSATEVKNDRLVETIRFTLDNAGYLDLLSGLFEDISDVFDVKEQAQEMIQEYTGIGDMEVKLVVDISDPILKQFLKEMGQSGGEISREAAQDLLFFLKATQAARKAMDLTSEMLDATSVWANPNISDEDKIVFGMMGLAEMATRGGSDITGGWFKSGWSTGFDLFDQMYRTKMGIGSLSNLSNDDLGLYINSLVSGHQCTNAGIIQSNNTLSTGMKGFFAWLEVYRRIGNGSLNEENILQSFSGTRALRLTNNEETDAPKGSENASFVWITGRMYAENNSYVNTQATTFSIYVNGRNMGTVENEGLTELFSVGLLTDAFVEGVNTVIRDYNTNPGSHYVTADTEYSVLVSPTSELAYIGSLGDYEELRPLPDFAIYPENVYPNNLEGETVTAIAGESTSICANVYNRGQRGGWTDIVITSGNKELYRMENQYIGAFSSTKVSFPWVPDGNETEIAILLSNKTVGVEERKDTNNTASIPVTIRERETPVIETINPETIVLESFDDYLYLTSDVRNGRDITAASFSLDGETVSNISSTTNGSVLRYSAKLDPASLSVGNHTVQISVRYFLDGEERTMTKAATVLVRHHDCEQDGHCLLHHEAVPAGIGTYGSIEYWICQSCGELFADKDGTIGIEIDDTVLEPLLMSLTKVNNAGGNSTICLRLANDLTNTKVMLASYNKIGMMTAIHVCTESELTEAKKENGVPIVVQDTDHLKAFLLDENLCPICDCYLLGF